MAVSPDTIISGIVRSVNEKGLKLEGHESEKARKRAWYLKNREQVLTRMAARRAAADPSAQAAYQRAYRAENAERLLAQKRAYYQENLGAIRARRHAAQGQTTERNRPRQRAYYAANRDRRAAYIAEYKRENKDAVNAWNRRRALRKRGTPISDATGAQWVALKAAYGQRCAYCGNRSERLTQDHVIPLSRRGSHTALNIVPACRSCNARKFTGPPLPILVLPDWSDLAPLIWSQS
jgi:5-methylcytosine-specific restriction endonuclease McrA